jgi:hypothetical protein
MKAQKHPLLGSKEVVQRVQKYAIHPQHRITIPYYRQKPESLVQCNTVAERRGFCPISQISKRYRDARTIPVRESRRRRVTPMALVLIAVNIST